jgi:hypothetical protein
MGKNLNDQELKAFLQRHQPLPPPAEPAEMERILARIERSPGRPNLARRPLPWIGIGLTAAVVLLALFFPTRNFWKEQSLPESPVAMVAEEDADFLGEELPDQEIGAGYLQLAGLE